MATSDAPLSVGAVTMLARNRAKLASFYKTVIGLNVINDNSETLTLGQNDTPLLHLRENTAAKRRPTEAGLFHTAFLLPRRADLGAWIRHASEQKIQLDGAADHLVSEAIYLQDPEGNGIEIYVDRDRSEWPMEGAKPKLATNPLDMNMLVGLSDQPWQGAPLNTVIGHVHLQVGDVASTDTFYCDNIGFDRMRAMSGASFYGSGGYHHHIAGNTWRRVSTNERSEDSTGLLQIDLLATSSMPDINTMADPSGIIVTVTAPAVD